MEKKPTGVDEERLWGIIMKKSKYIDHTYLKAFATDRDIEKLCEEAIENDFQSVCVNPSRIVLAKKRLVDSNVKVCTVIGFPLGASQAKVKAYEAEVAIKSGADEIDMVMNIGAAKSGGWDIVLQDIQAVVNAANGTLVKVIIENCYLSEEEMRKACEVVAVSGADFVKTSTGFGEYGARFEDVEIMKSVVGDRVLIKAAGGVRTPADLDRMIELGVMRIGTSSGMALIKGNISDTEY